MRHDGIRRVQVEIVPWPVRLVRAVLGLVVQVIAMVERAWTTVRTWARKAKGMVRSWLKGLRPKGDRS